MVKRWSNGIKSQDPNKTTSYLWRIKSQSKSYAPMINNTSVMFTAPKYSTRVKYLALPWEEGPPMISKRHKAYAAFVDNKIYLFGCQNHKFTPPEQLIDPWAESLDINLPPK